MSKTWKNGNERSVNIYEQMGFLHDILFTSPETDEELKIIYVNEHDGELKVLVGNDEERWLHTIKTEEAEMNQIAW